MDKKIDGILDALYEKHDLHLFGSQVESALEDAMMRGIELGQSKMKAENARLKEALKHIATLGHIYEEKASAKVAREALKGGE